MPELESDSVQVTDSPFTPAEALPGDVQLQSSGFLLELSADWLVLRASENVHEFLGEYHVTLIGEPLAEFVRAQPLHDLRNTISRQSGRSGIARAYRVRLTDSPRCFDLAFQLSGGKILLEGLHCADENLGAALGSVSGLIDGLVGKDRSTLLENAARRIRALTGFDCVRISTSGDGRDESAESSRAGWPARTDPADRLNESLILGDATAESVCLFPRTPSDRAPEKALLRLPAREQLEPIRARGIRSLLNVPIRLDGKWAGQIECENRDPREPSFELHAATELFAQMLALRLEIDRLGR
ncbi:GAF domain-containing protein [Sphingomonas sp.]|uniref:GAF domain-containing protein n=1 Tax=Sphingomonas sp. TaxID=28214 RepID=UPI0018408258|nr:GAF domain-containing protein [Sphingomonas sp.]MBA3510297.1 GAF domain-containing protein [Sphingomonas sp.]